MISYNLRPGARSESSTASRESGGSGDIATHRLPTSLLECEALVSEVMRGLSYGGADYSTPESRRALSPRLAS